jgi:hypothetical protein
MNSHRQYLSLGVVLAEYMTKSCLAYLPPGEQRLCDRMLRSVGIDLQSVGLGTVGQTAMTLAVTGAGLQPTPPRPPPRPTPLRPMPAPSAACGLAALHEAMDELQTIAAMHCPLPRGAHVRFLALLLEPNTDANTAISVQEASAQAYGREGAVWVKGGLFGAPPFERLSPSDLEAAYARWHALAVRGTALMRAADLLPLGRII